MHILMTTNGEPDVRRFVLDLAGELTRLGIRVTVASYGRPWPEGEAAGVDAGLRVIQRPTSLRGRGGPPGEDPSRWLGDLIGRLEPTLIHLNDHRIGGGWDHRPPLLVTAHSCRRSRWAILCGTPEPPDLRADCERAASTLRAADLVVAPSRSMLDALRAVNGPLPAARVIFKSCPPDRFPPMPPRSSLVLSVGRVTDEGANIGPLVGISRHLDWPVLVAAPLGHRHRTPGHGALPRSAALLDTRSVEDMAALMGRAGIFAFPVRQAGFGAPALAAALAGCPLVLSDIPVFRELWGDAACFVDPLDPGGLAQTLQALVHDDGLRDDMARRARARGLFYDPVRMAREYLRTYLDLSGDTGRLAVADPPCQRGGVGSGSGSALRTAG